MASADSKTFRSGWCLDGHCLPSVVTSGCPGTFALCPPCGCQCHRGEPSEKAVAVARKANLARAQGSRSKSD